MSIRFGRCRFLSFVFMVLLITDISAQKQNFKFNYLSTVNGLSNNSVMAVLEDSRGFIWIGTRDGLNRYDGYEIITFKHEVENDNSLPNNFINCLAEDSSKNIWIGTNQAGLVRFDLEEEKFYRYNHIPENITTIPATVIRTIMRDKNNHIWFGTDNGLARYNPVNDNFIRYALPINEHELIYDFDVRDIIQNSEKELIIQCNYGLYVPNIQTNKMEKWDIELKGVNNDILKDNYPILFDKQNNLWLSNNKVLIKYNLTTETYKQYQNLKGIDNVISSSNLSIIFEDNKNVIWIGTQDNGVSIYNNESDNFTVLKSSDIKGNGLSNNIINSIFQDKQSNIWIATQEGGLSYINSSNSNFEFFTYNPLNEQTISNSSVNNFYEDENGTIWVGTGDGQINKLNEGEGFTSFGLGNKLGASSILDIIQNKDENNSFYVSGWGVGLYEYNSDLKQYKNLMLDYESYSKVSRKNIKGLGTDKHGNIWMATHIENGLLVYSPKEKRFYDKSNPGSFNKELLSVSYPVDIVEDSKNRLWVVSYTGLYMFDSIFHVFNHVPNDINTISSDYLYTVFEDDENRIWVGSLNGLDRVDEIDGLLKFERINRTYKIPNNIKGILQDEIGNLWLSSNHEITQFSPDRGEIKHMLLSKELSGQEFLERSCLKAANGYMYFGGINGFVRFKPDSVNIPDVKNSVYLTKFMLFNKAQKANEQSSPLKKSIIETKQIELEHHQSVLSFEYAALNFNPFKTIEYAYKMEGFDNDWYFVGEKRSVTYTNLKHGTYTFRVSLVENNELIPNSGTELNIVINPPFWKTKSAFVIYVLLMGLMLYLFRTSILNREKLKNQLKLEKINIKNVRETNLMKLRFFTNISHEFRTPLTLIKAPIEKLSDVNNNFTKEEQQYHFNLIQNNTERLLGLVNQLMDYRKLEAGSLVLEQSFGDVVEFCKSTWSSFAFLAEKKGIKYTFQSQIKSQNMSFDRDKLDKILCNLLSNAFKFTPKTGEIKLEINSSINSINDTNGIEISISDTGVGIKESDLPFIFDRFYSISQNNENRIEGTGIGLTLAKELAELHKGNILVESVYGEGCNFTLYLPILDTLMENTCIKEASVESDKNFKQEVILKQVDLLIDSDKVPIKYKILIVEDDEELREFIRNELINDYEIELAKDGEEGLRTVSFMIPDLILSDVMMPKLDGFELCKRIKADERTSHIPIILLTARHSHEKHLEGLSVGANDYIFKPFSIALLNLKISNILNSRAEFIEKFNNGNSLYFNTENVENRDNKFIQSVIDIVLEDVTEESINADFIAEKLLVSRSLVYLKIEALTGQTVNEFVRTIRLKKSLRLLSQKNLTITEVAYAVGFNSQSYYTRSFKKQFGKSPKEYLSINVL
jgi:signal transduction histidine kinase/ligand-binding sensor domain-containing protein/DNA-binding response OmpR family regulator